MALDDAADPGVRRRRMQAVVVAVVGLGLLGAAATWPVRWRVERRLAADVERRLEVAGVQFSRVSFEGRDGRVVLRPGDPVERAVDALDTQRWPWGIGVSGPVPRRIGVIAALGLDPSPPSGGGQVGPASAPGPGSRASAVPPPHASPRAPASEPGTPMLRITVSDRQALLAGPVPDTSTRNEIARALRLVDVVDRLVTDAAVAPADPDLAVELAAAVGSLLPLASEERIRVTASDGVVVVDGWLRAARHEALLRRLRAAPALTGAVLRTGDLRVLPAAETVQFGAPG